MKQITYEQISAIIKYNPKSGNFYWLKRDQRKRNLIKAKHNFITGYPDLCVYRQYFTLQELAYILMKKKFPEKEIVPKDKNKHNICWNNLKQQDRVQHNVSVYQLTNVRGVWYNKETKLWRAQIRINREKQILGFFESFRAAVYARYKAERASNKINKNKTDSSTDYLTREGLI